MARQHNIDTKCSTYSLYLPSSIEHLIGLKTLYLYNCKKIERLQFNIYKMKSLEHLSLHGCSKLENLLDISRLRKGLGLLSLRKTSTERLSSIIALDLCGCKGLFQLEESLSGLCSLVHDLSLHNCNLLERTIPNSLGSLSSLKELNLREINFASLPAVTNQLTKLERLYLDHCSRLQVLTSLPSSIVYVSAKGCKSLERVLFPPRIGNEDDRRRQFVLTHCPKLSLSESLLQEMDPIVLSGSEIPDWFSSKSEGSSISLWADPHPHSKLEGIAVCAVLKLDRNNLFSNAPIDLKVNGYTKRLWDSDIQWFVNSDFLSDEIIYFQKILYNPGPFPLIHDRCYIWASMIPHKYRKATVKKCGIHLVMEKQDETKQCYP